MFHPVLAYILIRKGMYLQDDHSFAPYQCLGLLLPCQRILKSIFSGEAFVCQISFGDVPTQRKDEIRLNFVSEKGSCSVFLPAVRVDRIEFYQKIFY